MKTTLDLPDDLLRAVKIRAAQENRRLKDTVADLLRRGLAQELSTPPAVRRRVKLPLVECAHEARLGEEMTPERLAELDLSEMMGRALLEAINRAYDDSPDPEEAARQRAMRGKQRRLTEGEW